MTFRARLFLVSAVGVLVPLTVLALGVRRELERRLDAESRRRGDAAVRALGAELAQERERVAGRLAALAEELAGDNRFRLAAVQGEQRSRPYLLDWAGGAMRLSGLALLQLQDSAGRILSSGHFRNEYDQVQPDAAALPARPPARPPRWSGCAPPRLRCWRWRRRSDSRWRGGRSTWSVVSRRRIGSCGDWIRTPSCRWCSIRRTRPGPARPDTRVIGSLALPFLDAPAQGADSARLVVARSSGTLAALQRGLNTWFIVSLAVTALLALALAAWLSRLISRPLTELAGQDGGDRPRPAGRGFRHRAAG